MVLLSILLATYPLQLSTRVLPVLGEDGRAIAAATVLSKSILVTNAHVVEDNKSVLVRCGVRIIPARVAMVAEHADLALLRLATDCPIATPSPVYQGDPELGLQVWVVGYPLRDFAVKAGILSKFGDTRSFRGVFEQAAFMDAEVLPGNSGGPVLDENGAIVGITFGRLCIGLQDGTVTCVGAFIPAVTLRKFLTDVKL